jgi:dTDP-4-dehydrorhamnose 3,5-epimerase
MEVTRFKIKGPALIRPRVFEDERGYFYESYNESAFQAAGIDARFVQDNQSCSHKNVLRGLHFQNPPYAQGKLVRVIRGRVLDVAVDIRKNSPTFGEHLIVELSEENQFLFWIPEGFAHGFISLEDETLFLYKCTQVYNKASEGGIVWNDPDLNIDWTVNAPLVSSKDLELPQFNQLQTLFHSA